MKKIINHPEEKYMVLAIKKARENLRKVDGGPFGACIVKGSRVIATAKNTVLIHDATCHAEINAVRLASRKLKTHDLKGCVIYSTTEPCPMCFSAIHWAGIDPIIYGTSIRDARKLGFNEMIISNCHMKRLGRSRVKIIRAYLKNDCLKLFDDWKQCHGEITY